MTDNTCSIAECTRPKHAKGYCSRHYTNWRRRGDPEAPVIRRFRSPEDSFEHRTVRVGDCLLWTGYTTDLGYGLINVNGRLELVHRYAWERVNGPIPKGIEIDHSCHARNCCEPEHLRSASRHENMRNRNGAMATSRSGVRNVSFHQGQYRVDVNRKFVGYFDRIEDAAAAAAEARKRAFGEFAGRG